MTPLRKSIDYFNPYLMLCLLDQVPNQQKNKSNHVGERPQGQHPRPPWFFFITLMIKRWLPVHCQYVSILCGDLVDLTSEPCSFDYFRRLLGLYRFQEGFQLLAEKLGEARQNPDWTFSWGRLTGVAGVLEYLHK